MGSWRTISVALTANVAGYQRGLGQAAAATTAFDRQADTVAKRSASRWATFGKVAAAGLLVVATAMGASIREAISWESAFAGVRKTVDATEAEFAALSDGIVNMANRLPASREEIAGVAEAAGQLGIQTPNILGFSETMIGLGEATNLGAQDAATQLARLANITQMSQTDFDRLGSSVVALGNNFATTEAEIVAMSLRIASAGTAIGMSEADILALAAALSSVGIEAEAGGTAISRVMIKIAEAVDSGSDSLDGFARVADMSTEAYAALFRSDSTAAIEAFVAGLGTVEERGMSLFQVLDQLGLSDVRVGNALRSMAGAGDLLTRSLETSNDAWDENTALADEVAQRYATAESQLRIFANQVTNVARIAGAELVPMLLGAVDAAREFGQWLAELGRSDRVQSVLADIADAGGNIVDALEALVRAGAPVATMLAQLGGAAVLGGLSLLATTLGTVAGFLADNETAVFALTAALVALAAVRTFDMLSRGADRFGAHLSDLAEFAGTRGLTARLTAIGTSARTVGAGFVTMGTNARLGAQMARSGAGQLAAAIGPLNLAILGIGGAAAIGFAVFGDRAKEARRDIDALTSGVNTRSTTDLRRMSTELQTMADDAYSVQSQMAGIFGGSRSDEFASAARRQADAAGELAAKYRDVGDALDGTWRIGAVERMVEELDLDPAVMSVDELAAAITEFRATASTGVNSTGIEQAIATIGDEAANAEDRVDALQQALDELMSPKLGLFGAQTAYASAFTSLTEAVAENGLVLDEWSAAGQTVRGELLNVATSAKDMHDKMLEAGASTTDAIGPLREAALRIAAMGQAAGMSERDIESLLIDLGLTERTWEAQVAVDTGDAEAVADALYGRLTLFDATEFVATLDLDDSVVEYSLAAVAQAFDEYVRSDPTAQTFLDISDPDARMAELARLFEVWVATTETPVPTWMDSAQPEDKMRFLNGMFREFASATWTTTADADTAPAETALQALYNRWRNARIMIMASVTASTGMSTGQIFAGARGGIMGFDAGGIYNAVGPNGLYRFAEPSTKREMLLPELGIDRWRAKSILDIGAGWHGFGIVDKKQRGFAAGGIASYSSAPPPAPVPRHWSTSTVGPQVTFAPEVTVTASGAGAGDIGEAVVAALETHVDRVVDVLVRNERTGS